MSSGTVKSVTVTGGAAEAFMNGGKTRKRRRARTQVPADGPTAPQVGGHTSPGTLVSLNANKTITTPGVAEARPAEATALAKTTTDSAPAATTAQAGGASTNKPVKVILAHGKKKTAKVVLAPVKDKKTVVHTAVNKTRKVAKKIRMSLAGFGKRVSRAHQIRQDSRKQPITDVRKTLVEAKLIKEKSTAPEDILRKMYADYMMLKNRAL